MGVGGWNARGYDQTSRAQKRKALSFCAFVVKLVLRTVEAIMGERKFTFLMFNFVCVVLAAALLFFTAGPVFGGPYLDSAHGSSAYGVNRDRTAAVGYATGNCAHCHEQHGSIDGAVLGPHEYLVFYDLQAHQR